MSIVINGVDMPKGNSTKNLLIYSDGRVFTGHKNDVNYFAKELPERTGKRMDDTMAKLEPCPLWTIGGNCMEHGEDLP